MSQPITMSNDEIKPIIDLEKTGSVYKEVIEVQVSLYRIYLTDSINDSHDYSSICHLLRTAKSQDVATFYLSNFGGSCHAIVHLISAVKESQANVQMVVTSPCYSAAATLALSGNSLTLCPYTFLMLHNYSSVAGGKAGELMSQTVNTNRWIQQYSRNLHRPFITTKECNMIERDIDIYVHWDDKDLQARIDRHFKSKPIPKLEIVI